MALDENGRFLAMRVDILGNLGAYLCMFAPYIPWLGASMATGTYDIGALHARVRGVYTHTVPVDAYRGAGRPEAAYVLERLVDVCARELNLDPAEIRARNFVKPRRCPIHTLTDRDYDVGDFEGAMRACLAKADYAGFDARAEASKRAGKVRGFGFASYIECTAWGDGEEGSVALEQGRDAHRRHRHAVERAGARDRLCAGRLANISTCRWSASRSCRATPTSSPPATAPAARARFPSAR